MVLLAEKDEQAFVSLRGGGTDTLIVNFYTNGEMVKRGFHIAIAMKKKIYSLAVENYFLAVLSC